MTEQYKHLIPSEQASLLNIFKILEEFFDRTIGMWNTATVVLESKDDAKPV